MNQETEQRFIQHRVDGWSFHKIAQALGVPLKLLLEWSRKHQFEIANLRAMNLEQLQHKHLKTHAEQINALGDQLRKAEAELNKRDFSQLPLPSLLALTDQLRQQIKSETGQVQFRIPSSQLPPDQAQPTVTEWTP
jgi:hypothetical protein